jgi:hypothetical protein
MELEYVKVLIDIYQHCPRWEDLRDNRNEAQAMSARLVDAGLAERCKKTPSGVRVPDPQGPFLRLTFEGSRIVLAFTRQLPASLCKE